MGDIGKKEDRQNSTAPLTQTQSVRLWGSGLRFAYPLSVLLITLSASIFVVAVPLRWQQLVNPSAALAGLYAELGLPLSRFAVFSLGGEIVFTLFYLVTALMILLRRPDDAFALLTAVMLAVFGVGNNTITQTGLALRGYPGEILPVIVLPTLGYICIIAFMSLFPNGQLRPRWLIFVLLLGVYVSIAWNFPDSPFNVMNWPIVPQTLAILLVWILPLIGQVIRFRNDFSLIERQQTRWVMFGLGIVIGVDMFLWVLMSMISPTAIDVYLQAQLPTKSLDLATILLVENVERLVFLVIPGSLMMSILRYRLWDLDVIIRRTLQYALLTSVLGLGYFGSVAVLQSISTAAFGLQSPVMVVISTLAIAALFNPLRIRIQAFVDRRFFRSKYDAEQALAEFAAAARTETDPEQISAYLAHTVQQTLQPEQLRLWLKAAQKQPGIKTNQDGYEKI